MIVNTLRAWVIGLVWSVIIPGLNQFFFFRFPSVTISGIVAQLLAFPVGRAAAASLPNWKIFGLPLNPGPFSIKEHVLITVNHIVSLEPSRLINPCVHRSWLRSASSRHMR